jgi:hypothetical protein
MKGLGRLFDLGAGVAVVDIAGGAQTGNRVHLRNCETVAVVFFKEAGAAAEATTLTLQEHNAASAGTSQNLVVITEYWLKSEATLDDDELWVQTTQTAAATVVPAASDTQQILVFEVEAASLSDGFRYISVSTADTTTAGQFGGILYIAHGLKIQKRPDHLPLLLS